MDNSFEKMSCNLLLLVSMTILFQVNTANGQESIKKDTSYCHKNDATTATILIGSAFITGLLADELINNSIQQNNSSILESYFNTMNYLGDGTVVLPLLAVPWLTGYLTKNEKLQRTSERAFKSAIVSGAITELIKVSTGRSRPYMGNGAYDYELFRLEGTDYKSFPSGHTSLAFAIFTPFAETYSEWFYLIPISVGISRMYKNKHWLSDVELGAAIGYFSGRYFQYRDKAIVLFTGNSLVIKF